MFGKITLEVLGGTDINCAINEAIANARSDTKVVAKSHGGVWPRLVEFNFNNVVVTVAHDPDPDLLYRDWCRAMAGYIDKQVGPHPKPVLSKQEQDNDACIQAESDRKREHEEKVRASKERERCERVNDRLHGAPDIQIAEGQEETWRQITEKNKNCGILAYAIRWARLMQVEIAAGKTVKEIQESASHNADFEGMSGATHNMALSALRS